MLLWNVVEKKCSANNMKSCKAEVEELKLDYTKYSVWVNVLTSFPLDVKPNLRGETERQEETPTQTSLWDYSVLGGGIE